MLVCLCALLCVCVGGGLRIRTGEDYRSHSVLFKTSYVQASTILSTMVVLGQLASRLHTVLGTRLQGLLVLPETDLIYLTPTGDGVDRVDKTACVQNLNELMMVGRVFRFSLPCLTQLAAALEEIDVSHDCVLTSKLKAKGSKRA